jgi:hypothetical protein
VRIDGRVAAVLNIQRAASDDRGAAARSETMRASARVDDRFV